MIEQIDPQPGQIVVDGTLGGGGHSRMLAERVAPDGMVIALDRDEAAIEAVKADIGSLPICFFHANYRNLPEVLEAAECSAVDAVLLDIGLSSDQLADESRGFSYNSDGPLDLRFDVGRGEPAYRLLERLSEGDLADLIYNLGEERYSRRIAKRIVTIRKRSPIKTAAELATLVRQCIPSRPGAQRIDSATRTFQALRIAVNDELGSLRLGLSRIASCLKENGLLAVISFHSLEDRIVKQAFRENDQYQPITKKPIRPTEAEIQRNPRCRSAKLRVARRAN